MVRSRWSNGCIISFNSSWQSMVNLKRIRWRSLLHLGWSFRYQKKCFIRTTRYWQNCCRIFKTTLSVSVSIQLTMQKIQEIHFVLDFKLFWRRFWRFMMELISWKLQLVNDFCFYIDLVAWEQQQLFLLQKPMFAEFQEKKSIYRRHYYIAITFFLSNR